MNLVAVSAAAAGLGMLAGAALVGASGHARVDAGAAGAAHPVWTEAAWPFATDEWGQGKAYTCTAADCGAEAHLYVRPKIGFCNCTTGVSDNAELERLSDFDLVGGRVRPDDEGRAIAVGWMTGRSRAYTVTGHGAAIPTAAISVSFNDHCDAFVATVVVARDHAAAVAPAALAFLNSATVTHWARAALGL